jgi:hypothetical protein
MGGGCTQVAAEPFAPCKGAGWAGRLGVEDSWAHDVVAHPNKDSKAVPAKMRAQVCLVTVRPKPTTVFRFLVKDHDSVLHRAVVVPFHAAISPTLWTPIGTSRMTALRVWKTPGVESFFWRAATPD